MKKSAEMAGLHVNCPFCGHLCDALIKLSFCTGCYAEYWPNARIAGKFTFTNKPTGKQTWSKAIHRSGGVSLTVAK